MTTEIVIRGFRTDPINIELAERIKLLGNFLELFEPEKMGPISETLLTMGIKEIIQVRGENGEHVSSRVELAELLDGRYVVTKTGDANYVKMTRGPTDFEVMKGETIVVGRTILGGRVIKAEISVT